MMRKLAKIVMGRSPLKDHAAWQRCAAPVSSVVNDRARKEMEENKNGGGNARGLPKKTAIPVTAMAGWITPPAPLGRSRTQDCTGLSMRELQKMAVMSDSDHAKTCSSST